MIINTLFEQSPILETQRLVLRKLNVDDAGDYYEFASNPAVTRFTIWNTHTSIEDSIGPPKCDSKL
ncbi:GNAT family N-acetyltransferase [Paenibacillus pini]|uniref:GNAT family N-acetyltransferase n=1 Tax=Paenibacillus pini TaxID=669461 RepID=UPI0009E0482C|nr:GNAT family N-acetyltransferase [Paenibacillus pini]